MEFRLEPYSYLFRLSGMFVCVWAREGEGRGRKEREEEEEEVEMIAMNSQMYSKLWVEQEECVLKITVVYISGSENFY